MLSFHTLLCYVACLHICYRKETWTCLLVQATSSSSDDCVNCSNPQHPKQLNTLRLVSIKLNWKFREECFLSVISVNLFSCQIVTHHKPFLTLSVIAFFFGCFYFYYFIPSLHLMHYLNRIYSADATTFFFWSLHHLKIINISCL